MKEQDQFQLSKLVEHLSHELRTPLGAILGYSELLEKSENLDESEKSHLQKIADSGSHLLDIINDIIEISNIESGNAYLEESIIKTDELVSDLNDEFLQTAKLKEIAFLVSVDSNIKDAFIGDHKKIKTILFTLINNALKFTEKGEVKVDISIAGRADLKTDNYLQVEVRDSGIGIPSDEMQNIFKPFWQADPVGKKGTGLGLTTCQKLVDLLGGSLKIQSEKGSGTNVSLSIPLKECSSNKADETNEMIPASMPGKAPDSLKALIVDDMPVNRALARIMLEMKDFDVVEAENGKQALDQYKGQKPDVILMDISMPVMDGIEAMERIRKVNGCGKSVPIIAITAGGHTGTRSELIEKGFSEFIQKPFKEKELFEKISLFYPLKGMDSIEADLKTASLT